MDLLAYCRYSSENQRDGYSIEAQVRAIKEWAAREGHTVKKFYIDEARSGTTDDREEFQKMIAESAGSGCKGVVVHKLDRFARDRYASAVYRHKLKENGLRVISVLEPLDDSPESIMMEAVLEGMAEYYSRNLSREVRKGQKEAALKAQHVTGPVPYGYRVDEHHRYVVVPEEAAVIREIFRRLDGGESIADVARWAVAHNVKTHKGKVFNELAITRLTQQPILVGRFSYGVNSKDGAEPIIIENAVEPILEPSLFWRQYEKTTARKKGPRARLKEEVYLLTGYLFCEYCGSHLYGFKSKSTFPLKSGKMQIYEKYSYRCATKGSRGSASRRLDADYVPPHCDLKNIEKFALEEFVFEAINRCLFTGNTSDWIVAEMLVRSKKKNPTDQKKIDGYKSEIAKLGRQRDKLLDLYLSDGISKEAYSAKADELNNRAEFLETEIARLSPEVPDDLTADEVRRRLNAFVESANADSPEYKKRLLSAYVKRITVSNERIVIYFKFPVPGLGETVEKEFGDYFVRKKSDRPRNCLRLVSGVYSRTCVCGQHMRALLLSLLLSTRTTLAVSFLCLSYTRHISLSSEISAQILCDTCNSISYVLNCYYPFWIALLWFL